MFDKTAFKFIAGFISLLLLGFITLLIAGQYQSVPVAPDSQLCCAAGSQP